MPQFDRAAAKAAGYSDAEIDAFLARQTPSPERPAVRMPAQRELAPRESTRMPAVAPRQQPTIKEGPMGAGQIATGAIRSALGQGALFGFGDELEAAVTGRPREEIRGEMQQFREAYPKTAFATELAGGALTGGVGAARGAAGMAGRSLARKAAETAARTAAPAALAGAGQAEEGSRTVGAVTGGLVGGTLGTLAAPVTTRVASAFARAGKPADVVAQDLAGLARKANLSLEEIGPRAARLGDVAPDARVMDVLGRPAVRRMRGIAALGGESGEMVEQAMVDRFAGRPERMQQALTRTTGKAAENVLETADEIIRRRSQQANELYDVVRQNPPIQDDKLEALIRSRPSLRRATQQAQNLAAEEGVRLPMLDTPDGPVPLRTPEFLDYTKRALDDMLYRGKMPGEGGLGRSELSAIRKTKAELLTMLDDMLPGYKEARNAFAGETALKNALEEGAEASAKRASPNELARTVQEIATDSEREMFQRGYLDAMRQRIDAEQLKPTEIRSPKFAKALEAVFGEDDGARLREALLEDVNLMQSASTIIAGSRTAPLAMDIAEETAQTQPVMQAVRSVIEPRRAFARGVGFLENLAYGQGREATRAARAGAMLEPATQIGPLLERIANEQAMQRQIAQYGTGMAGGLSAYLGGVTGRNVGGR
jgi:hypothetical protein